MGGEKERDLYGPFSPHRHFDMSKTSEYKSLKALGSLFLDALDVCACLLCLLFVLSFSSCWLVGRNGPEKTRSCPLKRL